MSKFNVKITGSNGLIYVDKTVFAQNKNDDAFKSEFGSESAIILA